MKCECGATLEVTEFCKAKSGSFDRVVLGCHDCLGLVITRYDSRDSYTTKQRATISRLMKDKA